MIPSCFCISYNFSIWLAVSQLYFESLDHRMSIYELKFKSKNPSRKRASFESETKTSQLFLNENNVILINFVITVSYAIVMILANE